MLANVFEVPVVPDEPLDLAVGSQFRNRIIVRFLADGRQEVPADMAFGRSVTDACMAWETTVPTLRKPGAGIQP